MTPFHFLIDSAFEEVGILCMHHCGRWLSPKHVFTISELFILLVTTRRSPRLWWSCRVCFIWTSNFLYKKVSENLWRHRTGLGFREGAWAPHPLNRFPAWLLMEVHKKSGGEHVYPSPCRQQRPAESAVVLKGLTRSASETETIQVAK